MFPSNRIILSALVVSTLVISLTFADEAQCWLDCAGPTTASLLALSANPAVYTYSKSDTQRLVGPTLPTRVLYPLAEAPIPLPYSKFCMTGCAYYYSAPPSLDCWTKCDVMYQQRTSVGASDWAEKARLECRDGCAIAQLRCQPGYKCTAADGMVLCDAGTYRDTNYDSVLACVPCPTGTYRETLGGKSKSSCTLCPAGTYLNALGSKSRNDCLRCPDGLWSLAPGSALCSAITKESAGGSALLEWERFQDNPVPYQGRW